MANFTRTFVAGRMNKTVDERLIPSGEYIHAMNIRMGSTENSEIGVAENTKGNNPLTLLCYTDGTPLSVEAKCIGAIADSANEKIYWFVHDPAFNSSPTGKLDMIVSFNVFTNILTYHVISVRELFTTNTTLNFNPKYLITGIDLIEDLLFFTDDYNPPRFINIKRNYPNPSFFVDQIDAESLLVIKKPPLSSPSIEPIVTSSQDNYMKERFLSFAYRYKYADGEYSATSQWSTISFVPNPFDFSINSYLNEGMTNFCNAVIITYNSGGPLVVGIDLLFKQSNNNIIKVIEKLDKSDMGLANNTNYTYTFSNSKIFTVLAESELLRLYDNVPRFAKAQTIMGNRLMYGNYVEGYNMIDADGFPVKLEYYTDLITTPIGRTEITDSTNSGDYTINGPLSVSNSIVTVNLENAPLVEGASLYIEMTLNHASFSGPVVPTETTSNITIAFSFFLPQSYNSVYEMASSLEFQSAIGTALNIKPVYDPTPGNPTSCDGVTFTDQFNCVLPNTLTTSTGSVTKVASGITALNEAIAIITSPSSDEIGLQFPAMKYVDDVNTPTTYVYEYYQVIFASAFFQEIASPKSLHSNRDYEIGIVYMDEFLRSTTALVSPNNTEHIPCGYSPNRNSIQVTIPTFQVAPAWAKKYKFVIKPSGENYETIYCNLFFTDPDTNEVWFYLEGENARKIETGDRLIVKADSSGPVLSCAYATVLLKEAKIADFITPIEDVTVPAGVYMKINPNSFSAVVTPNSTIAPGIKEKCAPRGGNYETLNYPMNLPDPANPGMYIDYTVPAGSRIKFNINWKRLGVGSACEERGYILEKNYVASADYDNMEDWFNGDNIAATINTGTSLDGITSIEFIATNGILTTFDFDINYLQFYRNPVTNELILQAGTGKSCTGGGYPNSRKYCVAADIEVLRTEDLIIFETEPSDASPDIFYENDLSFDIDEFGQHMGNVQDQDFGNNNPAIIDTGFFNCFSFGNGAESYKIRDSIVGRSFNLGERVTAVSAQDYKEADRFADITYSGIYNTESNVNKLNEFNLGLLNFKRIEVSFGEIYILDGRETDVLVLQEDKISYVLAGKNLLSDSAAGGAIASVPEVLGTQIARTEKYGISFNPESYVQWGYDRFFTDAKRGAVIQLRGDSYSNEQISIISEANMRTWFRDLFNESFNTQKLGGFDPYMNEYVLASNFITLPVAEECLDCGTSQTFTFSIVDEESKTFNYCVDVGPLVGDVTVSWNVIDIDDIGEFDISATFGSNQESSGFDYQSGSFTINKDLNYVETMAISIEYTGDMVLEVTVSCPAPELMRVIEVVVTDNDEAGESMHAENRYTSGPYVSPLQSSFVTYASGTNVPLVSRYNMVVGYEGASGFPPEGSNMKIQYNKTMFDTRSFNPSSDRFSYLRSNTLYNNNTTDISNLLAASSFATPILGSGNIFYANFIVPTSSSGQYLYLIWDLRKSIPVTLCYHADDINEVCCNCPECVSPECKSYTITAEGADSVVEFDTGACGETGPYQVSVLNGNTETVCVNNDAVFTVVSGNPIVELIACNCTGCSELCDYWTITNTGIGEAAVEYLQCNGDLVNEKISIGGSIQRCVQGGTSPVVVGGSASMTFECGCPD